ncbi:hypothetical protein [Streptomyces sp. NBC_00443]|uniref:hypothetical protein n=1 Tax=Streptomyces sp. NBC_00443 TaxID=2975743 RepID=UPI002E1C5C85
MLAAAEAQMDAAAEDEQERARNRAKLYAPPERARRRAPRAPDAPRPKPAAGGMTLDGAQALMAQLAAQDAQLTGRRSG